jgi:hypothetical protein
LEGRQTGGSIEDLVANLRANQDRTPTQKCDGDLDQVTFIVRDGEQVLLMMLRDGVQLVAIGLYTGHLLETLSA